MPTTWSPPFFEAAGRQAWLAGDRLSGYTLDVKLWDDVIAVSTLGAGLILCDSQDVSVQVLVNYINHLLGNYGKTIDIENPSRQRQPPRTLQPCLTRPPPCAESTAIGRCYGKWRRCFAKLVPRC